MKNVKKAIALVAVIFGVSTASFAQNGFTVRAGGNFPVGTFGKGDVTDMALNTLKSSEFGGAATGFNVGLKYQLSVLGNISVFASADFFHNGLKAKIKDDLKALANLANNEDYTVPAYINLPVMVGVNYTILDIIGTTLWAEAGVGANFRSITGTSNDETPYAYAPAATFAWQVGVGVSVSNAVSLGLHYYGFGASEVDFKSDNKITDAMNKLNESKLNPSMVVVRLGYTF